MKNERIIVAVNSIVVADSSSGKGLFYSEDNGKTWRQSNYIK